MIINLVFKKYFFIKRRLFNLKFKDNDNKPCFQKIFLYLLPHIPSLTVLVLPLFL